MPQDRVSLGIGQPGERRADRVDEAVVWDVHLITPRTPADVPDFCRAIVEALAT